MKHQEIITALEKFSLDQLNTHILPFWRTKMIDNEQGGFYAHINDDMSIDRQAEKGLVLNARILWTFSAVYRKLGNDQDLQLAHRAYNYLMNFFYDKENGGFYWSLNPDGTPKEHKKQIYAQAFTIYGLSEYYKITNNQQVLEEAVTLFKLIEEHSYDKEFTGYVEACTKEWAEIKNLRLSPKDMNEKKSQNTHLHVLEAYTNLYLVWKNTFLLQQLEGLIHSFTEYILHPDDSHLILFFDEKWTPKSSLISYGHDIECSWLIHEAALATENQKIITDIEKTAIDIAKAAEQGYLEIGAMLYEDDREGKHSDYELEWWAQAEAVVGFLNVYTLNKDVEKLEKAYRIMQFIDKYIVDRENGEWFFRVQQSGEPIRSHEKAGFWKCPYHNARACLEILHRIDLIKKL